MLYKLDWKTSTDNVKYSNTDSAPDLDIPWTMGIYYPEPITTPVVCPLNPKRGDVLRDVYLVDIPLFSEKFISVIEKSGVNNLQKYEATLLGVDGLKINGYFAVNIVGLVECASLEDSEYLPGSEPPLMEFRKLVIDESKVKDFDIFRLGEDSLQIIISERLKNAIDEAQLVGFSLVPLQSK